MAAGQDIGTYYTIPVILSFDGIEKSVNSKLGKAFGDIGKKGSKQVADATVADLKKAEDAYTKLRNKAEDALGKVRVEEEKLKKARAGGKQDQITAAEERYNKALRDSKTAADAARRSYDDLQDSQRKLGDGTGKLGGSFGNLGDMAGKAGSAMAAAGVVAAGAALAGIAALGGGIVIAARQLYDLGQAFDDVADTITLRTGAVGPELDRLTNAVKNIAPSTASSLADIGSVVAQVGQSLNLTGADLEVVSKNITTLNRLTGQDLNVRKLGQAFRAFGIDAKDQVPSLDALLRVAQATGVGINEIVTSLADGGFAARQVGLGFEQTAALLATFENASISADAGLKALSLAAKNLSKDGKEPAAGLRETIGEIERLVAIGDSETGRNLAFKIFGRGAGPIFDAIERGAITVNSLDQALQNNGTTILGLADATDDWSERFVQLQNTLKVTLEPLATGVFNVVNEKLDQLADWVTNNQSKVIEFFQQLAAWSFRTAESIVRFAADALRAVGGMIKGFADGLADLGGVIQFIPGLGDLGDALQNLDDNSGGIQDKFNNAADALERNLLPGLQKGADYTAAFLERIKQATRFTEVLGDSVATINANGDIVLTDNTPEVEQKLNDLGITVTQLPDGTFKVEANTEGGQQALDAFRAQQEKTPIEMPVNTDTSKARAELEKFRADFFDAFNVPMPGNLPPINLPGASNPNNVSEAGLQPQSVAALRAIQGQFPNIPLTSAKMGREGDPYEWHPDGRGLDLGIPKWDTAAGKAMGDKVNAWILANKEALGVQGTLWQVPDHYNHIHVSVKDKPSPLLGQMQAQLGPVGAPGAMPDMPSMPSSSTSAPAISAPSTTTSAPAMSSAIDTSRLYSSGPLASTPGVNEDGEAGYFVPDPKRVRDAEQKAADADESIRQADAATAQARARLAELEPDAEQSARLSAEEAVRAAEARALKARREAADAASDLAETRKGEFTKAKDKDKRSGGSDQLGGLGSIASSFLQETFGFGSFLPALDSFMPLQMADTLIGAFMPSGDPATQTSSAPFGIPDLAAPPMPAGNSHGMGGMPGPIQNITVDQSQNFNNSPVGWDPVQTQKVQQNNAFRAPRLPVGMGS